MELAVNVAEQAAELIMGVYQGDDFDVRLKPDKTPVTQADLLAHRLIVKQLSKYDKTIPVLSEESTHIEWSSRKQWQTYWLIDPLDGTKEFVDKNDEFTVNIALIQNGEPIVGVIVAPALDEVFMAARGIGAFKRTEQQLLITIATRKVLEVNAQKEFSILVGRRSFSPSLNALFEKFEYYQKNNLGSSLKSCRIAEGKADIYPRFGKTSEWDTAAAQCILECAGGGLTHLDLSPLKYNTKESLINPPFIAWGDRNIPWIDYLN